MPILQGQFTDSAGVPIDRGEVTVTLRSRIIASSVTPERIALPEPAVFPLVKGVPERPINLLETQSWGISTHILVERLTQEIEYYEPGGELYSGPLHRHTDGYWYTDLIRTPESRLLSRFPIDQREVIDSFDTIVPNRPTVRYSELVPVSVSTDRYPTTIRLLAEILLMDRDYRQILADNIKFLGAWDAAAYYSFGNTVAAGGSSWTYISTIPTQGNAPFEGSTYWQLAAKKGDPGGTGGDNTPFGGTWQNDLNAASKGVLWAEFERRATKDEVNARVSRNSPNLTGVPTAPTQAANSGAASSEIRESLATCEYVERADAAQTQFEVGLVAIAFTANPPAKYLALQTASRLVSRTIYQALFARLGTTYSAGDGTTTFGLPPTAQLPSLPAGSGYWVISSGV